MHLAESQGGEHRQAVRRQSTCRRVCPNERFSAIPQGVMETGELAQLSGIQIPAADICDRSIKIAFEWICDTRLSVTPSTAPISASVIPSS